jgi:O-antigen/teichoic acid export membrane protein
VASETPTDLIHRLQRLLSIARLKPFDVSTAEGNSRERYRRVLLTVGSSFAARGISVVTGLISVPLTLDYLGTERYGIWMTISSLFAVLSFTDLGIGQGLVNAVASASGRNDRNEIRTSISSAFALLFCIGSICTLVALVAYGCLPIHRLFNVNSIAAIRETEETALVFASFFALSLPASIVQRFHEGLQEGYINQISQMAGSLLGLGLVLWTIQLKLGLPWLVLGLQGGSTLAVLVNFVFQFWHRTPWARPTLSLYNTASAARLLRVGLVFFFLTLLSLLGLQTDALVIAHVMAPEAVAPYAVAQKLSQVAFLYWALTQALWPAYSEAISRDDFGWVRRAFVRSLKLSLICGTIMGGGLVLFGQQLIHWWVRSTQLVSVPLLAGFGGFILLNSVVGTLAAVMNSGILLRQQMLLLGVTVPICFFLKVILCARYGVSGPLWASVIAFGLFYVLPGLLVLRKTFWNRSSETVG